ncbi:hypothetical protein GGR53DRAFT_527590 [Hypoxylon sp. FL1150]|nr:hypothetical protein GGR53DRAFT_527590 [Hypoxylon sp. FL1150]
MASMQDIDMSQLPALQPPAGVVSNFDNPFTFYPWILAIGIISMVLMTLAVVIRIYTKAVIMKSMKHEDYFAIFALAGFLTWDIIFIYVCKLGLARNQWDIRAIDIPYYLKMLNIVEIIYGPSMLAAKYFVLIQLKTIFCPTKLKSSVWWMIYGLVAATIAYYVACTFTFIFQCWPREAIWNTELEAEATCIDFKAATLVSGVINMVLDIGIFLVPLYAIWLLQMPMKLPARSLSLASLSTNLTMAISKVGLFTFAEYFGTILVGCMPLFPRFWARLRGKESPETRYTKSSFSSSSTTKPSARTRHSAQSSPQNPMRNLPYDELEEDPHNLQEWRSVGYAV